MKVVALILLAAGLVLALARAWRTVGRMIDPH